MKRVLPRTRPVAASTVAKGTSAPASRVRSAASTQARIEASSVRGACIHVHVAGSAPAATSPARWESASGSRRTRLPVNVTGVAQGAVAGVGPGRVRVASSSRAEVLIAGSYPLGPARAPRGAPRGCGRDRPR